MKLKESQKTAVPSEKELNAKKWFIVDVKGKTLGRISTKIANILRGKDKPMFTPQHDCGDYVVVINAAQIRLAGNKMEKKEYHWHSGYGAGHKVRTARQVMEKHPDRIIYDAVWGMMPRNKLRRHMIKKLRIFPTEAHTHTAQNLQPLEL